jgi:hypothetical protein
VFAFFVPELVAGTVGLALVLAQLGWLSQAQEVPTVLGLATHLATVCVAILLALQLRPVAGLHWRATGAEAALARVRVVVRLALAGPAARSVGAPWRTRVTAARVQAFAHLRPVPSTLQPARFVAELRAPGSPQGRTEAGAA